MTPSKGAALEWSEQELGGPLVEQDNAITCQTTLTQLAGGNGDRVALILINLGLFPVYVSFNSAVNTAAAIQVGASGGFMIMTLRDDFTLVTRQLYGVASPGASACYVIEIMRYALAPGKGVGS